MVNVLSRAFFKKDIGCLGNPKKVFPYALKNCSQKVNPELNNDLISIFSGTDQQKIPPFMKLFWEEHQRYLICSTSSTIRYHPIIIKYCLSLAAKA